MIKAVTKEEFKALNTYVNKNKRIKRNELKSQPEVLGKNKHTNIVKHRKEMVKIKEKLIIRKNI